LDEASGTKPELWDEIFAVVASPETGKSVRIYHRESRHRAPDGNADPASLGRLAAQMLIDAGAGPLLAAATAGGLK
jgi:hypothetical protein